MRSFVIQPLSTTLGQELRQRVDSLTKPKGALGRLEELAIQVGQILGTTSPQLTHPTNIVFCADHGIVEEGISQSPKEVTWQVVLNMLAGGAGVCYLCRQHGVDLRIVDVGVDYDFSPSETCQLISHKIARGTRSYLYDYAMTEQELHQAIEIGCNEVDQARAHGCNIISFGEMGITNTSASAVWMHLLADLPLIDCVGRGSGLNDEGVKHKYEILSRAVSNYRGDRSTSDIMRYFGGLEMVAAVGGMLRAAELRMPIIIDGFIMTACMLAASRLYPEVQNYAIFGHQGDEAGHARLLASIGAHPILHLGMRLGEGSGAVCAYPIIDSAVRMLNEMATFQGAGVTKYF